MRDARGSDQTLYDGDVIPEEGRIFTQRRFQVSRDESLLAWLDPWSDALRLMATDGSEAASIGGVAGQDARFSPGGRWMAAITGRGAAESLALVDVRSAIERSLGRTREARWLEWTRHGVVLLHEDRDDPRDVLTLVSARGHRRLLARAANIERFTAAADGSRVVYFSGGFAHSLDLLGASEPWPLGRTLGEVRNAEMSPDGRQIAAVTERGVQLFEGRSPPRTVSTERHVHSVWFAPDGERWAYASPAGATLFQGKRRFRLPAPAGDLRAIRFRRAGRELIVTRGRELLAWDPPKEPEPLAEVDKEWTLLAGDVCRRGTVLWVQTTPDEASG